MSRSKRPDSEYIAAAKRLAAFAPSLAKYKRRKKLTRYEKAAIGRKEKLLRYSDHLIPLTKEQARGLKDELFAPGVRAIQLRNTGTHTTIKKVRGDLLVTSNGRTWVYWRLDRDVVTKKRGMEKAAKAAFDMQFPIEQIADIAGKAFEELEPIAVYLWAPSGRVGRGFESLNQFTRWLYENWNSGRYTHQEKWVNGIAILLSENEEYGDDDEDGDDGPYVPIKKWTQVHTRLWKREDGSMATERNNVWYGYNSDGKLIVKTRTAADCKNEVDRLDP